MIKSSNVNINTFLFYFLNYMFVQHRSVIYISAINFLIYNWVDVWKIELLQVSNFSKIKTVQVFQVISNTIYILHLFSIFFIKHHEYNSYIPVQ